MTATPAVLIVYLALTNGGFDPIARSVVGVVVWWIVLIAAAFNVLPATGGRTAGRVIFGLAVAFAGWTALSLIWTESSERTATELARVSTYLGIFTLALAVQGTGRWRQFFHGVTLGVIVVCAIATLSRMRPEWFPKQVAGRYLQDIQIASRLAYPLNYSSGLGAFAAIGLPLALAATSTARTLLGKALAAGALPLVALTLWLTTSSLSVPVAVIALAGFMLLAPDRIPKALTLLVASAGSAILFIATGQHDAFNRGLGTVTAQHEGAEMLAITLAVCVGVAVAQLGLTLLVRSARRPGLVSIPRRHAALAAGGVAIVAIAGAIAAGVPGKLEDKWEQFKSRSAATSVQASRGQQILDFSGTGRYDFWESAVDANATHPWIGIGPGTWDYWWLQHGSYIAYVRDAHSLYLETLGELGIIGFALVVAMSAGVLLLGAWRAARAPPELRVAIAAATAGCAAFIGGATVDWLWELGVLPAVFFALAAIVCAGGERRPQPGTANAPSWPDRGRRVGLVALSVAGLIAIVPPLWGAVALDRSQTAAAEGNIGDALGAVRSAIAAQPYAAAPRLQEARLLASEGQLAAAVKAAREATDREPVNFDNWLELSQLEALTGHRHDAAAARRRARELNPNSPVFAD